MDSLEQFLDSVKTSSAMAVKHGEKCAIRHYMTIAGGDRDEAEAFYNTVKTCCDKLNIVIAVQGDQLDSLLQGESLAETEGFSKRRKSAEKILGCNQFSPICAVASFKRASPASGHSLKLRDVSSSAIFVNDISRLVDPSADNYVSDYRLVTYCADNLPDCKAASMICGMTKADLGVGPAVVVKRVMDRELERGRCDVLLLKPVTLRNVASISATPEDAVELRHRFAKSGHPIPVYSHKTMGPTVQTDPLQFESVSREATQKHFCVGDRVSLKPSMSHPQVQGTIDDTSGGLVVVKWDNDTMGVYDMVEALMRLMDAPKQATQEPKGPLPVVYAMPGMSDESVSILADCGYDPVVIYSMVSHYKPVSENALGWQDQLVDALKKVGLNARPVKGYVESLGDDAFAEKEWLEAELPSGARLVLDVKHNEVRIEAGDPDGYVLPDDHPRVEIE
jgi:hypothetical protein